LHKQLLLKKPSTSVLISCTAIHKLYETVFGRQMHYCLPTQIFRVLIWALWSPWCGILPTFDRTAGLQGSGVVWVIGSGNSMLGSEGHRPPKILPRPP